MPVLMTEDRKELIATCSCRCESSFHIMVDDEDKDSDMYAVLTYMKGNLNTDSTYSIWSILKIKAKRIWRIIRNKDYCYSEVYMTVKDFETFKEYISQF